MMIIRGKRRLLWGWLQDEVEVGFPVVSETVVGVAPDLPSARIASRSSVSAPDPDIDVLECHVPQSVIFRQFVQVFGRHVRRCLMILFRSLIEALRMFSSTT